MIRASVADVRRIDLPHHIGIRNENGTVIYVMDFEDAVTVQRGEEILSRASALRSAWQHLTITLVGCVSG
jgi:hypothetical protein